MTDVSEEQDYNAPTPGGGFPTGNMIGLQGAGMTGGAGMSAPQNIMAGGAAQEWEWLTMSL